MYLAVEVSWGSRWIDINDGVSFEISAENTRNTVAKSWRKITATSPVLAGDYLIHATPEMVAETISLWVRGEDHVELNENIDLVERLFTQMDYKIRWTYDDYRETWTCQLADSSSARNHVWAHNTMASMSFTVPRYPDVVRERI